MRALLRSVRNSVKSAQSLYNRSLDFSGIGGHAIDKNECFKLNREAALLGHYDAILAMGWLYINGYGVEKNLQSAEYWYKKSARSGEARAMFSLGWMAYDALAYDHAKRWFLRAIDHGHIRSIYWLGKLAWRGHGFQQSRSEAFALFHRAARKHDPEAIRVLRFLSRKHQETEQAAPEQPLPAAQFR